MWHLGTGRIQYDPPRGGMKRKTKWWCVINVDREITRYYRWWIERQYHIKGLNQPAWDAHISIIRGERPHDDLIDLWKAYESEEIKFWYKHEPRVGHNKNEGAYWFVEVDCPQGIEMRKEFNLRYDWPLHLTVGRTYF